MHSLWIGFTICVHETRCLHSHQDQTASDDDKHVFHYFQYLTPHIHVHFHHRNERKSVLPLWERIRITNLWLLRSRYRLIITTGSHKIPDYWSKNIILGQLQAVSAIWHYFYCISFTLETIVQPASIDPLKVLCLDLLIQPLQVDRMNCLNAVPVCWWRQNRKGSRYKKEQLKEM